MAETTFQIDIKGLSKLTKVLAQAPDIVEPIMQNAVVQSGVILAQNTNRNTVPWVTGRLAGSFDPITIGKLFARWYPRIEYARAVQFGIPASRGRFVPAIGKRLVNGANIGTWPGFRGRHYMEKIRSASVEKINNDFRIALNNAAAAIAKATS